MSDAATGAETPAWETEPRRLAVNVVDLRRRLGQRRDEPIEVLLAPITVVASRTVRLPVVGGVTVESIERGVSVVGSVSFHWAGDCRRCLEEVEGEATVEIDEIFQIGAPQDSDLIDFDGERIDLVPLVRDAVGLALPLAPLCRPDCAGPDPGRYPALLEEDLDREEPGGDPRWAALDRLDLSDS